MASLDSVAVVAEDQEFWRTGIASMLKRQLRYSKIVHALSYDQLIDALQASPTPNLATVELNLPGMQSYVGVRDLREQFPALRLVVIAATADRETILHTLAAGCHGFIPKRFQGSEILAAMTLVLNGHVFVPPDLTVKVHVNAAFRALGVHNRVSAVVALHPKSAS